MSYPGHVRAILVLGLPIIGSNLGQFAIGLTDTVMLGWYGVEALAAVTLAASYFFVLFLMGSGFAWAVMPMVAAYDAEGDEIGLRRATRMGLWLSTMFAVLAMPLLWWSEPVLRALGQNEIVAGQAAQYLRIAGWGIFPALFVMVLKSYLAALERTQIAFWITVVAALLNGLTNYALIFGYWGAPELGIAGAAIASVITQLVSLIGVVIYSLKVLPQHNLFQRLWRVDMEMLLKVFRLGVPIGLTTLSEVSLFTASAMMMGWLGTIPLAAHGIAIQLASGTFMVHLGLSSAATVRAGNAYGRGDRQQLARGAIVAIGLSFLISLATMALFLSIPEYLISLFLDLNDAESALIIKIGVGLLAVAALFQLVDGAQVMALGLLRGVQDTSVPLMISVLSYWVVGLSTSYYLGFVAGYGGIGVWMGLVVGLACAGVFLMIRFWRSAIRRVGVPD